MLCTCDQEPKGTGSVGKGLERANGKPQKVRRVRPCPCALTSLRGFPLAFAGGGGGSHTIGAEFFEAPKKFFGLKNRRQRRQRRLLIGQSPRRRLAQSFKRGGGGSRGGWGVGRCGTPPPPKLCRGLVGSLPFVPRPQPALSALHGQLPVIFGAEVCCADAIGGGTWGSPAAVPNIQRTPDSQFNTGRAPAVR